MNHAAVAPISQRVRDAMVGLLDDVQHFGAEHWQRWVETYRGVRRYLAQLINTSKSWVRLALHTAVCCLWMPSRDWGRFRWT